MRTTFCTYMRSIFCLILVAILFLAGTKEVQARTDLFFIGPATVVGEAGEEVTLTIYVKAERLRAFGFTLLLDSRYVTYVENSISKTEMTRNFDFLGANLLEDEVYDENRPYLKQLIFGGSVLEPVSSVWEEGGIKHGINALATFKLKLVDGFTRPPENYLLLPVATDKTVNDFKDYAQGGGILFFKRRGDEEPNVHIISPENEERTDDLNVTLVGMATPGAGQVLETTFWLDPYKIQEPSPGNFILGTGNTISLDFTERAPTIQTVLFGAWDENKNGAATFSVFGVQEDVVVIFQGMISGIVRNATLLTPISGAEVILYENKEDGLSRVQSVTTGPDGHFTLENVGKGSYTIIAHKTGFQEGSKDVTLPADNSTVEGVVIELFPLGRPTGEVYSYITGRFCISLEGEASPSSMDGYLVEDISGLYSCTTGEDGCCSIDGLRKGEDFKYVWHVLGQDGFSLVTPPQSVTEGETIELPILRPTNTTLEVKVLDPVTMDGVEGAMVQLENQATGETIDKEGPTGKRGIVTFYDLDPGEVVTITVTLEGDDLIQEVSWDLELGEGKNLVSIFVHGYEAGLLTREGDEGASLVIQLMDSDALRPLDVSPQYIVLTDDAGGEIPIRSVGDHYEATGLSAGNYTLDVSPPGYHPLEDYRVLIDGNDINSSTGLIIYLSKNSAPQVDDYTFGPLGQGTLKGVVLGMGDLEPVWNAQVRILDDSGNDYYTARTNAIGQFEKRGLSAGKYWVEVKASGFQTARYLVDLLPGESRLVTLKVFPLTRIQSSLESTSDTVSVLHGVVHSSVLDFSPHPLIKAHVRGVSRIDGRTLFEKETDASGNFVVKTSFGGEPFYIDVSATGYEEQRTGTLQLQGNNITFLSIFLMPKGAQHTFSTQGIGGSLAQYLPESGNLVLFGAEGLKLTALDETYNRVMLLDQWEDSGLVSGALQIFMPFFRGQSGRHLIGEFRGDSLHLIELAPTANSFTGFSMETTLSNMITAIAYRYPSLFVATSSGISSMDLQGANGDPATGRLHVSTNWHLGEISASFLFTNSHGLISVDETGRVYFVETIDPRIPVMKDVWKLYLRPLHGEIRGRFGVFCDSNGLTVPIKIDIAKGLFLRGRDYRFKRFKKALVFEIDHPLAGYEGKTMALALLLEDKFVDLIELTDLNLWLLRRYPMEGVQDIFLGRVWQEYSMGQDRYEGAFYAVREDGLDAIPLPTYLEGTSSIRVQGLDREGYLFTEKGYLFNLSIPGEGDQLVFHPVPGTYDLYFVKAPGNVPIIVDTVNAFGEKTVSFAPNMAVDLETINYPGGATRIFHEGDRFGVEINIMPRVPQVVDLYLLTRVPGANSTMSFYWDLDENGTPGAHRFGVNTSEPYPHPIVQSLYLNQAVKGRAELFEVPGALRGLHGEMEFYVIPAGVPFHQAMGSGVLGEDSVGFRIE